ncbi:dockerin type I domain-containing protein [Pseudobacteroides cellulosolvens]|uniref:Dockerin domain-containing protein n=1 Tax=Pseudobacteroides cellulosolvens ATCC 35603 = DSM 2933 TaxID=398512 RepID=A0A0L6JPH9_9FIRM|nr:dockerin type I domain-containing protein [Pseudobacteroides cellulosolvens]KNY27620.1 hypothetical protein Bccel_2891 [Pseudobacteroides cellulosolvens ATCC 35603 = DSM 2933]
MIGQPISVYTDVYGDFTINVSSSIGVCDIKITKPGFLMKELKEIVLKKDLQLSPITMWAGDMNGDNVINMADVIDVVKGYNTIEGDNLYIADYDLNKDGVIKMLDIIIIARNFNMTSYMN